MIVQLCIRACCLVAGMITFVCGFSLVSFTFHYRGTEHGLVFDVLSRIPEFFHSGIAALSLAIGVVGVALGAALVVYTFKSYSIAPD